MLLLGNSGQVLITNFAQQFTKEFLQAQVIFASSRNLYKNLRNFRNSFANSTLEIFAEKRPKKPGTYANGKFVIKKYLDF